MSDSGGGRVVCRYFMNNICNQGDRCNYSHDRNQRLPMVCQYYLQGSCAYGTACRYDHVKPRKEEKAKKKTSAMPKPVQLPKPGLNTDAPVFIPSWKKAEPGASYASAAGGSSATDAYVDMPTPLCPYYELGECNNADCQFIHGETCTMCFQNCIYPGDEEQKKSHIRQCLAAHEKDMEEAFAEARSKDKCCGICMENIRDKNLRFGILAGCRHCFCLNCIREWRRNQAFETTVVRSCPECRQHSDFVVPSLFWVEDEMEKSVLIGLYRDNTSQQQCKYYKKGRTDEECPFGNKCFYKHQLPDGSIDPGKSPHTRRRARLADFMFLEDDSQADALELAYEEEMVMHQLYELMRTTGFQ